MQGVYCHSTFTTYAGRLTYKKTPKNVHKQSEFSNHLGNVLVTLSDMPLGVDVGSDGDVDYYMPDVKTTSDYEPFGSPLDGRTFTQSGEKPYRHGFGSQEKDDEIYGEGNSYAYEFRNYDPRTGRFISVDPVTADYPHTSPYAFAQNCVISGGDLEGKEHEVKIKYGNEVRYMQSLLETGDGLKILAGFQQMVQAANSYQKQTGKSTIVYTVNPMNKVPLTVYDNKGNFLFMLNSREASDKGPGGWTLTSADGNGSWSRPGDPSGTINIDGMFVGGGAAPDLTGIPGVIQWVWGVISSTYDVGEKIGGPFEGVFDSAPDPSKPAPSTTFPDSVTKQNTPDGWVTYDKNTGAPLDTMLADPDSKTSDGKSLLQIKDEQKKK